jgi:mannose/cellobiose epimerase-like protein (N-acyl-D-glucosamine 2-epimerase family)
MIEVKDFIEETYQLLDRMMWEESAGLYADERSPDWSILNPYRGQNCNMHAVEAHLAAYRATQDPKHLHRAKLITQNMCQRQSKLCEKYTSHNFIYEHYLEDWSAPDLLYNKDNPLNMFKPWGFQPGHMVEWSRLLLDLHVISPEEWYIGRAIEFFKLAVKYGWDEINEGMIYSFEPSSGAFPCDKDKYKWVQAETFATAANLVLFDPKNANFYWDWYDRVWKYAWRVFIDHEKGGWYRILNEKNEKYDDLKSPPGKVDYHSIGACVSCLAVFQKL